jgi:hypothetical protein
MNLRPILLSISRYLARAAVREAVGRALPSIYARLDKRIPEALEQGVSPSGIECIIGDTIAEKARLKPTQHDIDSVDAIYSVIAASVPLAKRLLR